MHSIKYLLFFVQLLTFSVQLEQITAIYHYETVNSTEYISKNYYQYTEASYGPKPPHTSWNLSIPKNLQLCNCNQEKYIKSSEQASRMRRAILVARGNCTFVQKTKNAQKLGYDLIIISESTNVPILPTPTGNDSQITIPTIMISYNDAEILKVNFLYCPRGIEIIIGWQHLKQYKLPSIGFNIADKRSLSYLSEFYYHYYFEDMEPLMEYSFKLLYHKLQKCENRSCIPNDQCIFSGAQQLCHNDTQLYNGATVLRQQIRSYITYEQIGRKLWWKYVVLFDQNACFLNPNIDECFEVCLKEIKISTKTINIIAQLAKNMTNAHLWQFKILYPQMDTIELTPKTISNQYKSSIDKTLLDICHSDAKKPIQICKKITHQDLSFTIKDYNQINYQFVQPVGRINSTVTQLIRIRLSQIVLSSLDEVLIILSRCPGVVQWQFKACQPFEYQKHTGKAELTGKFGNWNKSQLTDDSMQLYSIQKYEGNLHIMNLKRKEIIKDNITLLLKLPTSYRTYLSILPKKNEVKLLQPGDVEVGCIADNYKIYELLFEDVTNPHLNSYFIKIEAHFSSIETSLFGTANRQRTFSTYTQRADPFFFYYSFPAIMFSYYSRNSNQMSCNGSTVLNCSLFLNLNLKTIIKNELFRISFIRYNQSLIYPIQAYQPFYKGISNMFERNISGVYVQLVQMKTFGDHSFGDYIDSSIVLSTGELANNIEVSFQVCREDYVCQIKSIKQWEQLQKNNKTRTLKHYQSKTSARNNFDRYVSTRYYNNVQHISFSNPANSFRRFLKVDKLNVYIVYKQKNYQKNETIRPRLLLPLHWRWDVIIPSANKVYSLSESCEFNIQKASLSSMPSRIILIHKKIDENIRIYTRIIRQDFCSLYFKTYIPQANNTLLNSIFSNYYYLDQHIGTQKAFKIQIIVQDKLKRPVDENTSYYSIGWSTYPASSAVKEIQLLEEEDRHVFAYTEKYTKGMYKYIIKSSSNVIILHFNAELSIFQDKIVLCTVQECFNHSHFKIWKDLKTNQVVTGLKVNNKIKSGFVLQILDFDIGNMGEYNLSSKTFEQLPIQVRIQTKVIQNLIEIKQIDNYEHVQQYEDTRVKQKTASQQVTYVDQKPIKQAVKQQLQFQKKQQQKVKPSNQTQQSQNTTAETKPMHKINTSEGIKENEQITKNLNEAKQTQQQKTVQNKNIQIPQQSTNSNNNKQIPLQKHLDTTIQTQTKKQKEIQVVDTITQPQIKTQSEIQVITQPQTKPQSEVQVVNQKKFAIQFAIILVTLFIICILLLIITLLFKLIKIIARNKLDIHQLYSQNHDIISSDSVVNEDK